QGLVVREQRALGEIRAEQSLDHRLLNRRAPSRLGHSMGVEGVAQLDPVEMEFHPALGPHGGHPLVAGRHLLPATAGRGGQYLLHGLLLLIRRRPPRPTLFPYTALFRSVVILAPGPARAVDD